MATGNNNTANVSVGKPAVDGAIFVAPVGTSLPANAKDALGEEFKCVGFISEDGLTNAVSRDSETFKAWGGATVKKSQTSYEETWAFKMIETNDEVMKVVYGDSNVTGSKETGLAVLHNEKELGEHAYVIETLNGTTADGKQVVKRICIPEGVVSEVDDIEYKDDTLLGYGVTVTGLPDAQGNCAYEYIAAATED